LRQPAPITTNHMDIRIAITGLQELQKAGVKHVVMAAWDARSFDLQEDDKEWPHLANAAELEMDWSSTHDQLSEIIAQELNG
jgi:hypothetical protein